MIKALGVNICWICGEHIDLTLPPSHAKGWTMDHVQPVSLRPDLAMDLRNIREAHRDCNGKRGANVNVNLGRGASRDW
ncbi:HNH endonuclease [Streptomyces sp. NPDC127178]